MVVLRSPTEPSTAGSAPQNVQRQSKTEGAPHNEKVAMHTVLRFLRFQAPWAYGRNLFVLLRSTPAKRWANIRHRLMDVAETRERPHSRGVRRNLESTGFWRWKTWLFRLENWGMDMVLSSSDVVSNRNFPSV